MEKILKVTNPPINCYPDFAYPLSIILNEEESEDWFFSNFIQIFYSKGEKVSPVNFYYSDLNNRTWDTRFPPLDYQVILKDTVNHFNIDIIDFVKYAIDSHNYCYIYVDEFYLPNSITYKKNHFIHTEFIYGYNDELNVLFMSGYDKSYQFRYYTHSYDNFRNAYNFCARDYYDDKNNIYMLRYNYQGIPYLFDMNSIYRQTIEYINSIDSSIKYNNCFNPKSDMIYGMKVIDQIVEDIKIKKVNVKCLCILREHKTLMELRLKYMLRKKYIDNDWGCVERFALLEKEYQKMVNWIIKYKMTSNDSLLYKLQSELESMMVIEREVFSKFIEVIENYM